MSFQWLSDLLLYEDFPTYCFGGTLFYYTIEAQEEAEEADAAQAAGEPRPRAQRRIDFTAAAASVDQ